MEPHVHLYQPPPPSFAPNAPTVHGDQNTHSNWYDNAVERENIIQFADL